MNSRNRVTTTKSDFGNNFQLYSTISQNSLVRYDLIQFLILNSIYHNQYLFPKILVKDLEYETSSLFLKFLKHQIQNMATSESSNRYQDLYIY